MTTQPCILASNHCCKQWCNVNQTSTRLRKPYAHYTDVIMTTIECQITSLTVVYSTVYSDAHQRKHQSSASLAFVWRIHRGPVNSPHKWPVTRKMFPFDDVIVLDFLHPHANTDRPWPFLRFAIVLAGLRGHNFIITKIIAHVPDSCNMSAETQKKHKTGWLIFNIPKYHCGLYVLSRS